jgi:hypothetical protein
MTKTLNQIIFFSSTKIRIFISATPFKLNGRSLSSPTVPYDFYTFFFFFINTFHLFVNNNQSIIFIFELYLKAFHIVRDTYYVT